MKVIISPQGQAVAVYAETINLGSMGAATIRRASHVEPDQAGNWWADLAPVDGPKLGPFALRSAALAAELAWLDSHLAEVSSKTAARES